MRCSKSIHRFYQHQYARDMKNEILSEVRQMTAQSIAERHITRREHDFTIEFALDVYILSADQLAGLIQQEAQRYMRDNRSIVDIAEYIGDFGVQR